MLVKSISFCGDEEWREYYNAIAACFASLPPWEVVEEMENTESVRPFYELEWPNGGDKATAAVELTYDTSSRRPDRQILTVKLVTWTSKRLVEVRFGAQDAAVSIDFVPSSAPDEVTGSETVCHQILSNCKEFARFRSGIWPVKVTGFFLSRSEEGDENPSGELQTVDFTPAWRLHYYHWYAPQEQEGLPKEDTFARRERPQGPR
jgi:hypothetical protein